MAEKITGPHARQGLPRWARVFLCLALLAVIPPALFVVIGLWPGLRIQWSISASSRSSLGFGFDRIPAPDPMPPHAVNTCGISLGIAAIDWMRYSSPRSASNHHYIPNNRRGFPVDRPGVGAFDVTNETRQYYWQTARHRVSFVVQLR